MEIHLFFSWFSCFPDLLSHVPIMKCSMVRNKISSLDQFIKQSWGLWEVFIASNNWRIIIRNRERERRAPSSLSRNNLCLYNLHIYFHEKICTLNFNRLFQTRMNLFWNLKRESFHCPNWFPQHSFPLSLVLTETSFQRQADLSVSHEWGWQLWPIRGQYG